MCIYTVHFLSCSHLDNLFSLRIMVERYFTLALVLGSFWVSGCHLETSNFTVEKLLKRVQDLEIAVAKLQDSQIVNSNTVSPTTVVPEVPLLLDVLQGITLGQPGDEKGFHVTLTNDVTLGIGEKIKFDTVVENIGGAYNPVTSDFICPTSGTYLFSLNIACQQDTYIEVGVEIITRSGRERHILHSVCDHRKRTSRDGTVLYFGRTQNGGTGIVSLKKGDVVSVKMLWPTSKKTISGNDFSSFSGYLLRPTQT